MVTRPEKQFNPFSVEGRGAVDSTQAEILNVPYLEMKQGNGALAQTKKLYFRVEPLSEVLSLQFLLGSESCEEFHLRTHPYT